MTLLESGDVMNAYMTWTSATPDGKRACQVKHNVKHNEYEHQFPKVLTFCSQGSTIEIRTDDGGLKAIADAIADHPAYMLNVAKSNLADAQAQYDKMVRASEPAHEDKEDGSIDVQG